MKTPPVGFGGARGLASVVDVGVVFGVGAAGVGLLDLPETGEAVADAGVSEAGLLGHPARNPATAILINPKASRRQFIIVSPFSDPFESQFGWFAKRLLHA